MKFIVDENLPPRLAQWLIARGHDAVHVRDRALRSDREIAEAAAREWRVIFTKDGDFDPPRFGERVIRLRIGNCSTTELLAWLDTKLEPALERLSRGEACVGVS